LGALGKGSHGAIRPAVGGFRPFVSDCVQRPPFLSRSR